MDVPYATYHGSPAFRFKVYTPDGWGWGHGPRAYLYVSKDRIALEPFSPNFRYSFDAPRSQVRVEPLTERIGFILKYLGKDYEVDLLCEKEGGGVNFCGYYREQRVLIDFMVRCINDFDGAVEEFERLTATLRPAPSAAQSEPAKPPPSPAAVLLMLTVQPANVQVYVDDAFKGMTSAEGRLVVEGLTPGSHRVRMNLIGYKEAAQTVQLKAGETATVEARLEPAGPRPLVLAEIEEALANGLPPKGITRLVNQYGVDFALTKEVEQRLREKGADSDLLVAIATNRK
jgi:hypothetical protein